MMMPRPRTIHDFYFPEANVPAEDLSCIRV